MHIEESEVQSVQHRNRFVSFVHALPRSVCLFELDLNFCGPYFSIFPFGMGRFPFCLWGLGAFPFSLLPARTLLSNVSWAYRISNWDSLTSNFWFPGPLRMSTEKMVKDVKDLRKKLQTFKSQREDLPALPTRRQWQVLKNTLPLLGFLGAGMRILQRDNALCCQVLPVFDDIKGQMLDRVRDAYIIM